MTTQEIQTEVKTARLASNILKVMFDMDVREFTVGEINDVIEMLDVVRIAKRTEAWIKMETLGDEIKETK
jgi:hypothetical protein